MLIFISEKEYEEKPELTATKSDSDNKNVFWKKYLDSLSHEELVMLVDKYAPSQYRVEIINRNSGKPEAKASFRKTRKKLRIYLRMKNFYFLHLSLKALY